MFGDLGILEILLLIVLGIIVFGGDVPEVGRKIGRLWGTLRRMLFDVRNQLENEARMVEGEMEGIEKDTKLEMDEMQLPTEEDLEGEDREEAGMDDPDKDEKSNTDSPSEAVNSEDPPKKSTSDQGEE